MGRLNNVEFFKNLVLAIPTIRNLHNERNQYAHSLAVAHDEIQMLREKIARLELSEAALNFLTTAIRELEDADFPVYMNTGLPSFARNEVKDKPRMVVVTIPKAGTYLISAYLKKIGLIDSGVHLDDIGFSDYRDKAISEMISNYREYRKLYSLEKSIKLLRGGQFAVGHIGFNDQAITALASANIIFMTREIRTVMVSMMRWLSRPGRGEASHWKTVEDPQQKMLAFLNESGTNLMGWFNAIAGWGTYHDVFILQFEILTGGGDTQADLAYQLAKKAGANLSLQQAAAMLDSVIGKPTKTWSGKHSDFHEFWSEETENLFRSIGGVELNRRLGYPE